MGSCIYGYGICTINIKHTSIERVKQLIGMAPRYEYELKPHYEEAEAQCDNDAVDFAWYLCDDNHGDAADLASILAEVIQECEGIRMMSACDRSACTYLIFPKRYPWQLTQKEKMLREQDVDTIIRKYVNVLTDDVLEIKEHCVEYD